MQLGQARTVYFGALVLQPQRFARLHGLLGRMTERQIIIAEDRVTNMHLGKLLRKVEATPHGTPELDAEFAKVFPSAPANVTRSIDAVVQLVESELPGWWWTCGYCKLSNDASLYVPGSLRFPYVRTAMGPDFRSGPAAVQLLNDPKWGRLFDWGFHRDRRGGTVPLAMLAAFLAAKIALSKISTPAK